MRLNQVLDYNINYIFYNEFEYFNLVHSINLHKKYIIYIGFVY